MINEKGTVRLKALLKFALDNLRYTSPQAAENNEYDFCIICLQPEWKHKKGCKAVAWEKAAKEALK